MSWADRDDMYSALDIAGAREYVRYPQARFEMLDGSLPLEWTPCNYGGYRAWLACPRCGRRTNKLFVRGALSMRARGYACRRCHKIEYGSQMNTIYFPGALKLRRAAQRLRVRPLTPPDLIQRPYRMHRKTYEREMGQYREAYGRVEAAIRARLTRTERRVERILDDLERR